MVFSSASGSGSWAISASIIKVAIMQPPYTSETQLHSQVGREFGIGGNPPSDRKEQLGRLAEVQAESNVEDEFASIESGIRFAMDLPDQFQRVRSVAAQREAGDPPILSTFANHVSRFQVQ